MTVSEIKSVAEDAAEGALRKFLLVLGVDVSTPPAMIELQKDFAHVRQSRVTMGSIGSNILTAVISSAVTGIGVVVVFYLTRGH